MGAASNYWQLCRLDRHGHRWLDVQPQAQAWFQAQFPALVAQGMIKDARVQAQLMAHLQQGSDEIASPAEACLRCALSHQIEQVCLRLAQQFGRRHGFTQTDLLPLVLNDTFAGAQRAGWLQRQVDRSIPPPSLALEILASFDPSKSSLSTWVTQRVKEYPSLKFFLQEHGILQLTDWALLNDTKPTQLPRILMAFHGQTETEVAAAGELLGRYHAVYRRDRLRQLTGTSRLKCPPPTLQQLEEMGDPHQSPAETLDQLQVLATQLRQYRLERKAGIRTMDSLDNPAIRARLEQRQQVPAATVIEAEQDQDVFLTVYRQQFVACLDGAIEQVLTTKRQQWQQQPHKVNQYLIKNCGYCTYFTVRGQSMGDIAIQLGLKAQYQVSRLLKLKQLRAEIRHRMVQLLRERTLALAADYADPERLLQVDQRIDLALDEQIERMMQAAAAEASTAQSRSATSLFTRQLCSHLERCRDD